jgi:beta-glucosidase
MKKHTTLFLIALCLWVPAFSQKIIELQSAPTPSGMVWTHPERQYFTPIWQTDVVTNVSKPTMTAYLPDPATANGTALIIAPGGGFMALSINSEGNWVADWAVKHGITAFVLKYRLAPTGEDAVMEFMQGVGDRDAFMKKVGAAIPLAIADGKAAIAYVRNHAAEFGVKPDRIGIIGFSAGGGVVGGAVYDHTPANRPDFAAPIYPALLRDDSTPVPADAMPLFIACTADDVFGFQKQSTQLFDKWNAAGKPVELHLYEKGGHGFGAKKQGLPSDAWLEAFGNWLASNGLMKNYRDLNHNGKLDIYEDASQPVEKRVEDLLKQMTLEEKAGQMFINGVAVNNDGSIAFDPSKVEGFAANRPPAIDQIGKLHLSHFNVWQLPSDPRVVAKWYNAIQKYAETTRLGIPVTIASDPRNHFTNTIFSMSATGFSQWPEPPGFAAIGDEKLVHRFADIVRQEYLAVGIRESLFPQIDLTTEPRWPRISGNFSEDAELTARLVKPYIEGLQTNDLRMGVATMTKHFPGGGPQNEGLDSHFPFHKGQVYPGKRFDYHLIPFEAAFKAGTAAIMPYYGVPVGQTDEEVAMSFNKTIITKLLREKYQYDGVVCTDWGLISDNVTPAWTWPARAWGVEGLSEVERVRKALDAGVDQFGGESKPEHVVQLVKEGKLTEARIDLSVRRLLALKFRLGLFDDPYVNEAKVTQVVGNPEFQKEADAAQRRAMTLLKNDKSTLPLKSSKIKIYVKDIKPEIASQYGTVVNSPREADVAIIRLNTPWVPVETDIPLARMFHHGDLDFKGQELQSILDICKAVPTIVDIYLDRPAVIPEINAAAKAVLANFGASDAAVLDVVFGKSKPEGKLPFELPSSMEAVRKQKPDVPYDSEKPLYPFGFGLRYKYIVN